MMEKHSSGFTLIEVLIAMTVVLVVCLVIFNLFHASLRYSSKINEESMAALIAEKKIEEIRIWAYRFDKDLKIYNFQTDWTTYSPYVGLDPDDQKFRVSVKVKKGGPYYDRQNDESSLYYPCTASEINLDYQRKMTNSMARVQVTVSWDNNRKQFTTITCIAEPTRRLARVDVTNLSGSSDVPSDGTRIYKARGFDQYNNELKDITFKWSVIPSTGNGEIIYYPEPEPRSPPITVTGHDPVLGKNPGDPIYFTMGERAVFVHRIKASDWRPLDPKYLYITPEGKCRVKASAQSGGVLKEAESDEITVRGTP